MALSVRPVPTPEALAFLSTSAGVTYQQCPSWPQVVQGWDAEQLGWFDERGQLCAYATVLKRGVGPQWLGRHLAYLPEGPAVDWAQRPAEDWLAPLVEHLRRAGAFAVKISPRVVESSWEAQTVKDAIRAGTAGRLGDVAADATPPGAASLVQELTAAGWRRQLGAEHLGVSDHAFELPLAGRTPDQLRAGLSQQWRRNVKKAEQAGVEIRRGGPGDVPAFHEAYRATAARSGFPPETLASFERMAADFSTEDADRFQLYLASHEGEVLGAAIDFRVGAYVGYGYGGSRAQRREVQPNTLLHWRAIGQAVESGAQVYDMRGIDDTLDSAHPMFGMLGFKLGTNGRAVRYVGEWDLVLDRPRYEAMRRYRQLRRRQREFRAGRQRASAPG